VNNTWRRVAVTVVALATAVAATQAGSGPVLADQAGGSGGPPALAAISADQDGRALFRGVFFLNGPHSAAAAEVLRAPAEIVEGNRTPEAAAYVETVVDTVAELDPAFFAAFSSSLRSGDPFQVERALDDGRQLVEQANQELGVQAEFGQDRPQYETHAFPLFLVAVAVVVVAVASLAVGGNIAVAVEYVAAGAPAEGSSDLAREQTVSALTEAFAG
jgi:SdpC family antimicrobial peptide